MRIRNLTPRRKPRVQNGRRDILAANALGEGLYSPFFEDPFRPVNVARFVFLHARASEFFIDWSRITRDTVAALRSSEEFRTLWR